MLSNAFKQLSADVNWGELDYLIIDLPPGTGDVHLSLIQQIPLSGVLIVTNPEEVSIADARKAMSMFKMPQLQTRILGIVENMSYFEAEGTKYHLFGEGGAERLSNEFEVEVLAKIPVYEYDKRILLREHFDVLSGELVRRISVMNASN
jgi:ATP-binding protein involved in chromosome partitioning